MVTQNIKQPVNTITLAELLFLFAGLLMAIAPHANNIPGVFILLFCVLTLFKLLANQDIYSVPRLNQKILNGIIRTILMIVAASFVFSHFGTFMGRDAGVSLLVILTGFKILETENHRDFYVTCFLGYFIIATNFFYNQSILTAFYMLITLLVMTTGLIYFNDKTNSTPVSVKFRTAGILILQSLPFMFIMFLFFPRVDGPLWGLPEDAHASKTGLSDEMSPGSISQLVLNDDVAFRIKWNVDNPAHIPRTSDLYWRGPVFWHNDGRTWTAGKKYFFPPPAPATDGPPVDYTITLEPNNKRWVFALELVKQESEQFSLTHDFTLLANHRINSPKRFRLTSFTKYKLPAVHEQELRRGLQLPGGFHKKTIALARSWRETGLSSQEIINKTLQWFREDNFYYTLSPALLTNDHVDEFLFSTKEGFCENYTSAFVTLMRAAGIPARVVTGYQGGTYNPIGNYLIVYQRNAHAWAEVWLEENGWTRIDPTSAVAPERVSQGIENAFTAGAGIASFGIDNNNFFRTIRRQFRYGWDMLNNQWNQWIISYNSDTQIDFFNRFGFKNMNWQYLSLSLVAMILAGLGIFIAIIFLNQKRIRDQASRYYYRFCKKLAKHGLTREAYEGPVDYAQRANGKFVNASRSINTITELYIAVRYAGELHRLDDLRKSVSTLKL